jgi:esterase/lipase superfamily enzyme
VQSVDRYNADEGNAMWAVQHLIDFLWKMLTEYELEKVHIIGHR